MKFLKIVLWVQTVYYFLTALWALLDIDSFMAVTGPKTDIWLVKTVAVLLAAISLYFFYHLIAGLENLSIGVLAISCCIGLICIDCVYSFSNIISKIYLADAAVQFILLVCWVVIILKGTRA